MAESTDRATAGEGPEPTPDWCHWHGDWSDTALVVKAVERPSGAAPYPLSACAPCRMQHALIPLAEQTTGSAS